MLLLWGLRQFGWKGGLGAALLGVIVAGAGGGASPPLRERISGSMNEMRTYESGQVNSPTGLRIEYWKKSLAFIAEAPLIGHGTGTIPKLFQRDATPGTLPELITTNPHNQTLAVAIELGLMGVVVLLGMWLAHIALFRGASLAAWFGLLVVSCNVVSSLFNSHLFDFGKGCLYVLGVAITGGLVLYAADPAGKVEEKA